MLILRGPKQTEVLQHRDERTKYQGPRPGENKTNRALPMLATRHAGLSTRLLALRQQHLAAAGSRDTHAALMEELHRLRLPAGALALGEPFHDFLLPDAEGRLVGRDDLLGRGPLVLAFVRGDWCPFCAATLDALHLSLPWIAAAGGTLVILTSETGGRALGLLRRHGPGPTVLADVDQVVAMACGLVFRIPDAYRRLLEHDGIDLAARQGNADWRLPVPAAFVLDRAGMVRWRHVDPDFTRRAEPTDLAAAIAALSRQPTSGRNSVAGVVRLPA